MGADEGTHHIQGRFGLRERCENGDFAITFVDLSTCFQNPEGHLVTWHTENSKKAHQINSIGEGGSQ